MKLVVKMGRNKLVTEDQILDAAEKVVSRVGPLGLTLDAVAIEADIGKATVVYDFKNKYTLISALVSRAVENDNKFNQQKINELLPDDHSVIIGRTHAAQNPLPDNFKDVALSLCAALAQDTDLRKVIQENQKKVIHDVLETSSKPRSARLAYLALEGLKLLESLDYYHWPVEEREEILRDIRWLVNTDICEANK